MLFPIIKISDNGHTHIVGTNSHDLLYIDKNAIHYLNRQCSMGTRYEKESRMYFEGRKPDEEDIMQHTTIEMVTLEELIEIAEKNMIDQTEASLRMHERFRKYLEEKEKCDKKRSADDITDTSGMLF